MGRIHSGETIVVEVHLESTGQPICYEAVDIFEKGSFFCVYYMDGDGRGVVDKYPIDHIYRVRNWYSRGSSKDPEIITDEDEPIPGTW